MGRRGIRGLKTRVGRRAALAQGVPNRPSSITEIYNLEESEEEVIVFVGLRSPEETGTQQGGQLQEWELLGVLNLEKESTLNKIVSTLNRPIWSRCGIAPTYPSRSHFQRTLNRKRRDQGWINVATHQEKERNAKAGKREAGEEKKRATDFKEAACCPSAVV